MTESEFTISQLKLRKGSKGKWQKKQPTHAHTQKQKRRRIKTTIHTINILNPYKDCFADIGMRQSGKTNWLKWYLSFNKYRYTLFDVIGSVQKSGWTPTFPQIQRVVTPKNWDEIQPLFAKTAKEVWQQGNTQFIIDDIAVRREVKGKMKAYLTDKYWMHPELAKIMNQGGNRNISLNFTAQRVAQVHNDLLANCKHHIIFKLYLPQDIDWYAEVIGKEAAEASQELEDYCYIYKELGKPPKVCNPVKKMC